MIVGVRIEIRLDLGERVGALARHRQGRPDPHLDLIVVRPLGRGLVQDLKRAIRLAQPEQRVANQRVDKRRVRFSDECQLPRPNGVSIAPAGCVAGSEVESRREELRIEPKRLAEFGSSEFEIARGVQRQPAQEGHGH